MRTWVFFFFPLLCAVLVEPQGVGVQVNNQALFTAGVGLLLTGLAFHAGRKSAYNEQRYYDGRPTSSGGIFSFFRRRRHTTSGNQLDSEVDKLLMAALEKDTSGCVLQLTCAVGRTAPSSLTGRVKEFHAMLSSVAKNGVLTDYHAAFTLGQDGGDCDLEFPHCFLSSSTLVDEFQTIKITDERAYQQYIAS